MLQAEEPEIINKILQIPFRIRLGISGSYLIIIAIISLLPKRTFDDVPFFLHMDKVVHFLMYGGLAALVCWTFNRKNHKPLLYYSIIILLCGGYGILMEILQDTILCLNRSFSWSDAVSNLAGICVSIPVKERLLPCKLDSLEQTLGHP